MSQPTVFHHSIVAHERNQQILAVYQSQGPAIAACEQQILALPFNGTGFRYMAIALANAYHATDESSAAQAILYYHAMRAAKSMADKLGKPITFKDLGIDY